VKPIKALILDFDGVLAESNQEKDRAFELLAAQHPECEKAMVDYHYAHHAAPRSEKFRYYSEVLLAGADKEKLTADMAEEFSQLVVQKVVACPAVVGATEFLREFSPQIPIYISSVTPHQELQTIISQRDIQPHIVAAFGNPPYPKHEAIGIVLEREGLSSQEVVFVGDSISDYEVAVAADLVFLGRQSDRPFDVGIELHPDMFSVAAKLREMI
jgi:phosphoglycolate phosphatase-like HAD superfamily hydrolase